MTVHCPSCHNTIALGDETDLARIECPFCKHVFSLSPVSASAKPGGAPASDRPLAKGDRLAGYRIDDVIGSGGMATVYRATQISLNRPVALKLLSADLGRDPAFVKRFEREAKTVAALDHPNIVRVIDRGHEGDRYFFVMDYVEGENLRQRLSRGRVPADDAVRIAREVAQALEYAHGQGVLHRDVKPENILIDRTGRVRVADFGLSKILGPATHESVALTKTNILMGTLEYMAPEIRSRTGREADARSDLYSLGVLLYEMLTGDLPIGRFAQASAKGAPAALDAVLDRLLATDPAGRFTGAAALAHALDGGSRPEVSVFDGMDPPPVPKTVFGWRPQSPVALEPWTWWGLIVLGIVTIPFGGLGVLGLASFGGAHYLGWVDVPERRRRHAVARSPGIHVAGSGGKEVHVGWSGIHVQKPGKQVRMDWSGIHVEHGEGKGEAASLPPERSDPFAPSAWRPRREVPPWTFLRFLLGLMSGVVAGFAAESWLGDFAGWYVGILAGACVAVWGRVGFFKAAAFIWFTYLCFYVCVETGWASHSHSKLDDLAAIGGLATLGALLFVRRREVEVQPDGTQAAAPRKPWSAWAVASGVLGIVLISACVLTFVAKSEESRARHRTRQFEESVRAAGESVRAAEEAAAGFEAPGGLDVLFPVAEAWAVRVRVDPAFDVAMRVWDMQGSLLRETGGYGDLQELKNRGLEVRGAGWERNTGVPDYGVSWRFDTTDISVNLLVKPDGIWARRLEPGDVRSTTRLDTTLGWVQIARRRE